MSRHHRFKIYLSWDKGSTTPLPLVNEEEVQPVQEEEPQQRTTDEVSEEGKIYEEP